MCRSPALSNGSRRYSKSPIQSRKSTPTRTSITPLSPRTSEPSSNNTPGKMRVAVKTKLQLVDLAGSECVGKIIETFILLALGFLPL